MADMKIKKEKAPRRKKGFGKILVFRVIAAVLLLGAVYCVKLYKPDIALYIKSNIEYTVDINPYAQRAKEFIKKHTP